MIFKIFYTSPKSSIIPVIVLKEIMRKDRMNMDQSQGASHGNISKLSPKGTVKVFWKKMELIISDLLCHCITHNTCLNFQR